MPERLIDIEVAINVATTKQDYTVRLVMGDDETAEAFLIRVRDWVDSQLGAL